MSASAEAATAETPRYKTTSGRLDIRAIALEPIHHGGGTAGNTQILRRQEGRDPETGQRVLVPYISGNSMKHLIRNAAVEFAIEVMRIEPGELTKAEVDLLFSGGHLSSGGAAVDLARGRRIAELFPALSMCGYSAGNAMPDSKIRVEHMHLVCAENAWRIPPDLAEHPMLEHRAGALIAEEFGTRHDRTLSPRNMALLSDGDQQRVVEKKASAKGKKPAEREKDRESLQMIYDFQVVVPGSAFYGGVEYNHLTDMELAALASAFYRASSASRRADRLRMYVGAKSNVGFGAMEVQLIGSIRVPSAAYEPSTALVAAATRPSMIESYNEHLRSRRAEILAAIREAVS